MSENKSHIPDDYFQTGPFEVARFGRLVVMRNNRSPEEQTVWMRECQEELPKQAKIITDNVAHIRELVSRCNPLELMKYIHFRVLKTQVNQFSEFNQSSEDIMLTGAQDYIQALLLSKDNCFNEADSPQEQQVLWDLVLAEIEDLYKQINAFYHLWGADQMLKKEIPDDKIDSIIEAQMMYLVKGYRYQVFELDPISHLLPPQNDILVEAFGITAQQVIDGLRQLQYSLAQGFADASSELMNCYDHYCKEISIGGSRESALSQSGASEETSSLINKVFGASLNDVQDVTGWPASFIEALSWEVGECKDYYHDNPYSWWPIIDLPTRLRPFIQIGKAYYVFGYHELFDNIYRIISKAIFRVNDVFKDKWNKNQNIASEQMVKEIFQRLLPGAEAYLSNFYPVNTSLKQTNENDILILYDDVLLVIEVKAGSFPQTPPITDYNAHIHGYRALAEQPDSQCARTIEYLNKNETATFFNKDKSFKMDIRRGDYRQIYSFSVTIDNFNEVAARIEKCNAIHMSSKTIVVSYDDLLAYAYYFSSPLVFLHYLEQRIRAIDVQSLQLYDELDHLGLYIKHNMYSITARELPQVKRITWNGYREQLDQYYNKLIYPELKAKKPEQVIPSDIQKILNCIERQRKPNRVLLSSYLLNLCDDARKELSQLVYDVRQMEYSTLRLYPIIGTDGATYVIFIDVPGIAIFSEPDREDYLYTSFINNIEESMMRIDLKYGKDNNVLDVSWQKIKTCDISKEDIIRLQPSVKLLAQRRLRKFLESHPDGIKPEDTCPCASGKMYMNCCMNKADQAKNYV